MRVTIVSCVYPPEPVVSARTSSDLAEALRRRGHDVRVIASFPHRPGGRVFPPYRRRWRLLETSPDGVSIERVFGLMSRSPRLLSRLGEALSFGLTSAWAARRGPRPDVAYVNSWPLAGTGLAVAALSSRGVPIVVSVQDVYPESLASQGRIASTGLLARFLTRIDSAIARRAAAIVVIAPRFGERYAATRGVDRARVHLVPNWSSGGTDEARAGDALAFRRGLGVPDEAVLAVFGGNVNSGASVETLVAAMKALRDDPRLHLLVAGEGSELDRCVRAAGEAGLERVRFLSPWPEAQTAAVLGSADVLLLPTHGRQPMASVPSKLIAYFLAGRPVVALAAPGSDLSDWIAGSGAGWVVPPDDPASLAERLRTVASLTSAERAERGARGRATALREMTREANLPKLVGIVEAAAADERSRGPGKPVLLVSDAGIRSMRPEDVDAVVGLHVRAFPGFFLSSLGPAFLRLLYMGILSDPGGLACVAERDGELCGFVAGVLEQRGFYSRLIRRRKWRFAAASVPALLRRPRIALRLLRALRAPALADESSASACLLSIAVDPASEGKGIGARLVGEFCRRASAGGASLLCLTTDRDANERTNAFYGRLGFTIARTFQTPEGRAMNEFRIVLPESRR